MCGFYGITGGSPEDVEQGLLKIQHRGPDSKGIAMLNNTILGHVRLSILGLDAGYQPIKVEGGLLAFNGEIYNFKELIQKYEIDPGITSDTEVLVLLFNRLGWMQLLKEIQGMFAIAIVLENEILLARDRYGQKPLYYSTYKEAFQFGSDLLSFNVDRKISNVDPTSLNYYMSFGFIPAPYSVWKGVAKLEPGQSLRYNIHTSEILKETYYSVFETTFKSSLSYSNLLGNAVDKHSISDVGSSMLISGGVDSSILASFSQRGTKFYTVKWKDSEYDESSNALSVADHLKRELNVIEPEEGNLETNLIEIIDSLGEPFADDSMLSLDNVLKAVKLKGEKVVLSGDGADEIFSGYNRYNLDLYLKLIPEFVLRWLLNLYDSRTLRYTQIAKLIDLKRTKSVFERHYKISQIVLTDDQRSEVLTDFTDIRTTLISSMQALFKQSNHHWKNIFDLRFLVEGNMMVKGDRISMKNSLELRVPFLDEALVTKAINQNSKHIRLGIKKFKLKYIFLKKFGLRRLQKKMGFGAPLLTDYNEEYSTILDSILINKELQIWKLINQSETKRILSEKSGNFKRLSFAIIVLAKWLEKELD